MDEDQGPTAYNFVVIIMTGLFFQEAVDGFQGPIAYNFVVIIVMSVCFSGGYG